MCQKSTAILANYVKEKEYEEKIQIDTILESVNKTIQKAVEYIDSERGLKKDISFLPYGMVSDTEYKELTKLSYKSASGEFVSEDSIDIESLRLSTVNKGPSALKKYIVKMDFSNDIDFLRKAYELLSVTYMRNIDDIMNTYSICCDFAEDDSFYKKLYSWKKQFFLREKMLDIHDARYARNLAFEYFVDDAEMVEQKLKRISKDKQIFKYRFQPVIHDGDVPVDGFGVKLYENGILSYAKYDKKDRLIEEIGFLIQQKNIYEYNYLLQKASEWLETMPGDLKGNELVPFASTISFGKYEPIRVWDIYELEKQPQIAQYTPNVYQLHLLFMSLAKVLAKEGITMEFDKFFWEKNQIQAYRIIESPAISDEDVEF